MRQTMRATLVGLMLCLWPGALLAAQPAGFVAGVRGQAALLRAGETLEARIGQQVQVGDVLTTGKKGRLKILLSDDSVLALGGGSRVTLSEHIFASARPVRVTRIELQLGVVRALVQKVVGGKKADFEVRSGTAVAGVRGTEFAVLRAPDALRLVTFSGAVEWSAGSGEDRVVVAAGEGSRVEHDGVTRPQALAAADLKTLRRATETEQVPTALAWNLGIGDKLSGGPGAVAGGSLSRDARQQEELNGGQRDYDFKYEDGSTPDGQLGGSSDGHARFGGGFALTDNGDPVYTDSAAGDWESAFDLEAPSGYGSRLNLRVNVHHK